MTTVVPPTGQNPSDGRQSRLLVIAWTFTMLPLFVFAYLTWESYHMHKQLQSAQAELDELERKKTELETKNAKLEMEIAAGEAQLHQQRESTKHYRDFAGIRIQFYRESDREMVEQALENLGFQIDTNLGRSRLISRSPNTIAFGKLVSEQDLRDIAIALVQAGFPLQRIAPAVRQPDPKLIQIYASTDSDRCGLLRLEDIRAGRVCGPREP